jgi:hypothetical protein
MTEYRDTESGVVVRVDPPPKRRYGLMELQDEEERRACEEALRKLAIVMKLSRGPVRRLGEEPADAMQRQAYGAIHRHLGELLLGDDYPGWEEWT